mgnify:CR=1 FL=1
MLQEKTKTLMKLREQKRKIEEKYDKALAPLKTEIDMLSQEMMTEMRAGGQFSARFSFATLSMAVRKTPKVIDEEKVIACLREKGLANEYVALRLNALFYQAILPRAKDEPIDGIEVVQTEYLSVSAAKEEKDRRKQAE